MKPKNLLHTLLLTILLTNCAHTSKTPQAKRPYWNDPPEKVIKIEKDRLGTNPEKKYQPGGGIYKILVYKDRIFSTHSRLAYYFEKEKLKFFLYSSSDPAWDKKEFNFQVHNRMDKLYGKSREFKIGIKNCYQWTASDAYIYYIFRRKHQDRNFWRTFLAIIVYSSETIEQSEYLRRVLEKIE